MTWKARRERRRSQAAWGPCGSQEAPDARGQDPTPTADEVERGDEVGTTDLVAPRPAHITARSACPDSLEPAETGQNTPVSIQKPTSWDDHDVGLSAMQLVGVAGFEPTTSSSRTKRATKLRHTPCAAGDSIASTHRREEIGSAESSVTSVFAPS